MRTPAGKDYRLNAHLIAAAGIVVLMLLMALIARAAAGRRVLMGFFSLLLVALIARPGLGGDASADGLAGGSASL